MALLSPNLFFTAPSFAWFGLREVGPVFSQSEVVLPMKPNLSLSVVPALPPKNRKPPSLALRVLIAARAKARRRLALTVNAVSSPVGETNKERRSASSSLAKASRPG
jgi:hypothetical protein